MVQVSTPYLLCWQSYTVFVRTSVNSDIIDISLLDFSARYIWSVARIKLYQFVI